MEYFILDTSKNLNPKEINELYTALVRGEISGSPNKKITAFLNELHSKYPHNTDLYKDANLKNYPWKSSFFEVCNNAVVLSISSRLSHSAITNVIKNLCRRFDFLLYDPSIDEIIL